MLNWPSSNENIPMTGSNAEPDFIRKYSRSPLLPPMSSSLLPLTSQTAVDCCGWHGCYKASGLEVCTTDWLDKTSFFRCRNTLTKFRLSSTSFSSCWNLYFIPCVQHFSLKYITCFIDLYLQYLPKASCRSFFLLFMF